MKHNEHEIQGIRAMAKKLRADRLVFKRMYNLVNFPDSLKGLEEYSPVNPKYRADPSRRGCVPIQDQNFCGMAWNYPAMTWDGDLYPCCFDCGALNMGNVFKAGFKKIWNSRKFVALRKGIASSMSSMPVCADCRMNLYSDNIEDEGI